MTITTLPDVPLRTDAPATFVSKADAFMAALPTLVDELNAFGASLTTLSTDSTSSTSLTIGTGSKTLTVGTGKSYQLGMSVKIASTAGPTNWMHGDVTAYNSGTGSLTVTVSTTNGSGTVAAWTVSASAPGGATLASNTFTGAQNEAQGSDIASAATLNLTTATGNYVHVTGTTGITAITLAQGYERTVVFDGALTLTHGASLILPGAVSITTAAGDSAVFRGEAAGVVRCVDFQRASGPPRSQMQLVTSGTTWTSPVGITAATVFEFTLIGPGGGGGGVSLGYSAAGGGAGGQAVWSVSGLAPNTAYACTIGTGGAGGTTAPTAGSAGTGNTTLTIGATTVTCTPGSGGAAGDGTAGNGGAGGTATNGTINIAGQRGGAVSGNNVYPAGAGGSTLLGFGGAVSNSTGNAATGYGAGGGGATYNASAKAGGAGANGVIVAKWVG